jgi:ABC-type bacteriocin/lantibiotic exporter with double-glycine peptidase domain
VSVPAVILPRIQRGAMDCGLCCLQTIIEQPDETIQSAALKIAPRLYSSGLYLSDLQKIAKALGVRLRKVPHDPLPDDQVGILRVRLKAGDVHYVVLFHGTIQNPADGATWETTAYLHNKVKQVTHLLVEVA